MIEKQIEHCKQLLRNNGACIPVPECANCPGKNTDCGCWDPITDFYKPSPTITQKATEWLEKYEADNQSTAVMR